MVLSGTFDRADLPGTAGSCCRAPRRSRRLGGRRLLRRRDRRPRRLGSGVGWFDMRIFVFGVAAILTSAAALAQDINTGPGTVEARCRRRHGADGNGAQMAPAILPRPPTRDDPQLAARL